MHLTYGFIFRNMLSAAHALAMDAKNLLDVVDSVRLRYPDLFQHSNINNFESLEMSLQNLQTTTIPNDEHESIDPNDSQTYQNVSQIMKTSSINVDEQQNVSNQCGIYDNECDLNDDIDKMNFDIQPIDNNTLSSNAFIPAKPPVAAKPINLQKLKANFSSSISTAAPNKNIDPLKIIETDDDTCN